MKRKICVLTQPLHNNYGGLLQAYALQKVLRDMGHDVVTDERPFIHIATNIKGRVLSQGKHILMRFLGKRVGASIRLHFPTQIELDSVGRHTKQFVLDHIKTVDFTSREPLPTDDMQNRFDTFVVGSDQVWRPQYSYIPNYFLDFAANRKGIKRLTYAASFGVSDWEFSDEQTQLARQLATLFDAISVREDSAVGLCKEKLGVDAMHVLDPTLLLSKEDYIALVKSDGVGEGVGKLMSYVLDESSEKQQIIDRISRTLSLTPRKVMPKEHLSLYKRSKVEDITYPKPSEWIRGFMDAEYVVTDSFHGTVFAIIFNKPFVAIANKNRGLTRFTSLLKIFNLEDRLIFSPEDLTDELIHKPIDYDRVNAIRQEWIAKSMNFLKNALGA
ncbi:MAG: polysaccharide pyruvyl transferase family protein [Phocaeicola sp.]